MTTELLLVTNETRRDVTPAGCPAPAWEFEVELVDTLNVSEQKDVITIRTRVSPPLPDHPQAHRLAALLRARALLDAQIQEMQSPGRRPS